MDPGFLVRVLNSTSLPSDEIKEFIDQYVQTMFTTMLETLMKYMVENGYDDELSELREIFEELDRDDLSLEDYAEDRDDYYEKWGDVIAKFMKEHGNEEIAANIDKAIKELDNYTIEQILDGLSPEDREKVEERIDIINSQIGRSI
jgi:hypothetical protein